MGSFANADDIVLLSPSISSLKLQLEMCEEFSKDYNIKFNAEKVSFLFMVMLKFILNFKAELLLHAQVRSMLLGSEHEIKQTRICNACLI